MIDYKKKELMVKTKKDELRKLMVLSNKNKVKALRPLAIQPMERKKNYEVLPNVPIENKIRDIDWNTFVDNVEYLDGVERELNEKVIALRREVSLLLAGSSLIKEKTDIKWIVESYPYNSYRLLQISNKTNFGEFMAIPVDTNTFTSNFLPMRKWVIDYQNDKGELNRNIMWGRVISKDIHNDRYNITIRYYYLTDNPLKFIIRSKLKPYNVEVDKNWERIFHISSDTTDVGYKTNEELGVLVGITNISENPNTTYLFPMSNNELIQGGWEIKNGDIILTDQAPLVSEPLINGNIWRPYKIGATWEEAVDYIGLTNWEQFILIQLQYNSEFSEDWGKSTERENPQIQEIINLGSSAQFYISRESDTNVGNPATIKFDYLDSGEVGLLLYTTISRVGWKEIKIRVNNKGGVKSARPSDFFTWLLTPKDNYSGAIVIDPDLAHLPDNWKEAYNYYSDIYWDLWTNIKHRITDWQWKIEIIPPKKTTLPSKPVV